MSLLLIVGNYFLWSLFTLVSGVIGGYGLAAGFDGFKRTKLWLKNNKNSNYVSGLEEEMLAGGAKT